MDQANTLVKKNHKINCLQKSIIYDERVLNFQRYIDFQYY